MPYNLNHSLVARYKDYLDELLDYSGEIQWRFSSIPEAKRLRDVIYAAMRAACILQIPKYEKLRGRFSLNLKDSSVLIKRKLSSISPIRVLRIEEETNALDALALITKNKEIEEFVFTSNAYNGDFKEILSPWLEKNNFEVLIESHGISFRRIKDGNS